jgi:FAD/FMN-containing dehydrogenase
VAQKAAAAQGLLLPIDLGARGSRQIGGVIANNAGGLRVIRYGMSKLVKNNTVYILAQLFTGSEGSLGIIASAVLRLRPLPQARCTALCAAGDFGAVVCLLTLARKDLPGLSALEVIWQDYSAALEKAEGLTLFPIPPPWPSSSNPKPSMTPPTRPGSLSRPPSNRA